MKIWAFFFSEVLNSHKILTFSGVYNHKMNTNF